MANSGISTKQKAAIRALIAGASYVEAAAAAKCHENTIAQWMRDPAFLAALRAAETDAMSAVSRSLVGLASDAAAVLRDVIEDPTARDSSRIRAADVALGRLMDIRKLADLEERVHKLEGTDQ